MDNVRMLIAKHAPQLQGIGGDIPFADGCSSFPGIDPVRALTFGVLMSQKDYLMAEFFVLNCQPVDNSFNTAVKGGGNGDFGVYGEEDLQGVISYFFNKSFNRLVSFHPTSWWNNPVNPLGLMCGYPPNSFIFISA